MILEIWKPICGYETLYEISNLGNVKSLSRIYFSGRNNSTKKVIGSYIMKPRYTKVGYCRVVLTKNGVSKDKYIHRLVAETFLPNSDNLTDVNHINENKHDNRVENLEWGSHVDNCNYGTRNERLSIINKNYRRNK